jgi:hypothetical protein
VLCRTGFTGTLATIAGEHASESGRGRGARAALIQAALAVVACLIALMVAASAGGNDALTTSTFASAGIECAPSPDATAQVFLKPNRTQYEVIAARVAIASTPGVTIDQYLDHELALSQLSCMFPNAPGLVRSTRSDDVPVSFAIAADPASAARLQALPDVSGVVTPQSWDAWWSRPRSLR